MRGSSALATAVSVLGLGLAVGAPAAQGLPGGVFTTGHDPDFHARVGGNATGARNLITRALNFVTDGAAAPQVLYVTSRISPPTGHVDGVLGLTASGVTFDVASAGGAAGTLDLSTVGFGAYDAVIVASDFGGILTQPELDLLNARSAELHDYVNAGGGVIAFAESDSGAHLTPAGGHFDFLPFLGTEQQLNQNEAGFTVTSFGSSLGLTNSDVNGNASHNFFTNTGGLQVVNHDAGGRIMSLAARGAQLCAGGVPSVSVDDVAVDEGAPGDVTLATFTLSLNTAPCAGPASIEVATADDTATGGSDFTPIAPAQTITFAEGVTSRTVSVPVLGDAVFEPDEQFLVELGNPSEMTITDRSGTGTIRNDDPQNNAPDCSSVAASPGALWPPNHKLRSVTLSGASDPDGDTVAITITGVTQDEPLQGTGDGDTAPDAAGLSGATVGLRAERAGGRDGRVYRIAFSGTDPNGGACTGTATVGVPRDGSGAAAVDSGGTFDSFGS